MKPEPVASLPMGSEAPVRDSNGLPPIRLTPGGGSRRHALVGRALRAAAERLADESPVLFFADAPPPASLDGLQDAILQWMHGEAPALQGVARGPAAQRLLGALRTAFLTEIDRVSVRLRAAEVVHVMRAFEEVGYMLRQATEAPRSRGEVEPDGARALVEVAHDMRSPLASILFLVETLRSGHSGVVNPVQERQLGLVYGAAFGLSSLASDLIELAHSGERLLDSEATPFSIREIFAAVRDIVLPIAEEKGLILQLRPPEADWRMGSPAALHRVLLNLTTNALKFTSEGFVEVSARQLPSSRVEFAVTDTGRGIPADVLPSLCEAFRQCDSTGRYSFSSAGLGLSICRKLVRRMGGELRAEAADGKGSRLQFTLDLPLAARF